MEIKDARIGQDTRSSAHFVAFDKKAYLFYCSCDAFILAFSEQYEYADEMKKAIEDRDINNIASIIASCEVVVKNIEDYQKFLTEKIDKYVESMILDPEYIDVEDEFEEIERFI